MIRLQYSLATTIHSANGTVNFGTSIRLLQTAGNINSTTANILIQLTITGLQAIISQQQLIQNKMRILFIDIDGVINSDSWYASEKAKSIEAPLNHFDPRCI